MTLKKQQTNAFLEATWPGVIGLIIEHEGHTSLLAPLGKKYVYLQVSQRGLSEGQGSPGKIAGYKNIFFY